MSTPRKPLPIQPAHLLPARTEEQRWLITGLWLDEAVGMIGAEPKSYKTFLGLDMAVSVASGTPCLRHFPVPVPGRVLLYAAEDALHIVRRRLEGICAAAQVSLPDLDIQVITAPTLRLDLEEDRMRLTHAIEHLKPRLLVLDPFVRLHRIDENVSGEVAPLLAFLRELQRRYRLAVTLVHHAKKGGARLRAGQTLRGSSEFHAWGDSNLYLRRTDSELTLSIEHRAAPSPPSMNIELTQRGDALALGLRASAPDVSTNEPPATSIDDRIMNALQHADQPLSAAELRKHCAVRKSTLYEHLMRLTGQGRLIHSPRGYCLAAALPERGSGTLPF
jgi:AAA domain